MNRWKPPARKLISKITHHPFSPAGKVQKCESAPQPNTHGSIRSSNHHPWSMHPPYAITPPSPFNSDTDRHTLVVTVTGPWWWLCYFYTFHATHNLKLALARIEGLISSVERKNGMRIYQFLMFHHAPVPVVQRCDPISTHNNLRFFDKSVIWRTRLP